MQKITPFLWFDANAEEAVNFYASVFPDSKINTMSRYPEGSNGPAGEVMVASFELFGQTFTALNGGPHFTFNQAVSFVVSCDTQEEIDRYWAALSDGGEEIQCGWIKDRFGLPWQIVPSNMGEIMSRPHSDKAYAAMMRMVKLDKAALERASRGE